MIAIDTNLLLYAHRSATPEHRRSRRALEEAAADPQGWGIALPSLAEFWSVVTHPAAGEQPSSAEEAESFLLELDRAGAAIWRPGEGFGARLLRVARATGHQGPRVFDLQIALVSWERGAREIWTHDRSFVSVPALCVHDPLV